MGDVNLKLKFDEVTIYVVLEFDSDSLKNWVRISWKGRTVGYVAKSSLKLQGLEMFEAMGTRT